MECDEALWVPDLEIRLSGAVEASRDGEPVAIPGKRARALLVLLAVSSGQPVSAERLIAGVWDESPPDNPRASLHTIVARLRRLLGDESVVTRTEEYALLVPRSAVDLLRFQDLVEQAGDGSAAEARERLRTAMELWRGEPFGGAPSEWIDRQLVAPWVERHLEAYERLVDLELSAGRPAACVPALWDLVERHPFRETLWSRLLVSLHRGGRTADALERYEAMRTVLADELGTDPAPELRALHQRLLANDEIVSSPAAQGSGSPPCTLPSDVDGFTGRAEQVDGLDEAVKDGVRTIAVHGPGGVGKTALVIHWARNSRDRYPDGQLFVDLRGYGPGRPTSAFDAADVLLRGMRIAGENIPADEDGRLALLRSELADRRMLLVLDNARAADQVSPLLPGGDSAVVVTSRSQLRGLASRVGARRIQVDPMPGDDAMTLLRRRVGGDDPETERSLEELATLCGHLPVALVVAAERAGRDGVVRLEAVVESLRDEQERIAMLADWDDDTLAGVRGVFAWSYDVLDTSAARMLRLLGLVPDDRIAVEAAAALAGVETRAARRVLDRLTDSHLLREVGVGWYAVHDLTHAYAAEVAQEVEPPEERAAAVRRLRSWYLHSVHRASDAVGRPWVQVELAQHEQGVTPAEFAGREAAQAWFHDHARAVRSVLAASVADEDHATVVGLTLAQGRFLAETSLALGEDDEVARIGLRSAERLGDPIAEAICANRWATRLLNRGGDEAMSYYTRARDLYASVDHGRGVMAVDINIGLVLKRQGRFDEAVEHHQRVLREYPQTEEASASEWPERARIENNLADIYLGMGRPDDALEVARTAVRHMRAAESWAGDLPGVLNTLAEAHQAKADWAASLEVLEEALAAARQESALRWEIVALKHVGLAHRALDQPEAARQAWERATEMMEGSGMRQAYGVSVADLPDLLASLPTDT